MRPLSRCSSRSGRFWLRSKGARLPLAPFQTATVEAAMQALSPRSEGLHRYLVADEVGLGKTVVARAVIAQLQALCPDRRLNVLYITSGQAIAGQNRLRLAENVLAQPEDRLSLLATSRHSPG